MAETYPMVPEPVKPLEMHNPKAPVFLSSQTRQVFGGGILYVSYIQV